MRHLIPISGKDSLANALVQIAHEPNLPYELFCNIVGKELPPFFDWLDGAETALKRPIERIEANLAQITQQQGILPSAIVRFCTKYAKIRPMERWIGKDPAVIYYGLRADEPERTGYNDSDRITARYPLREHKIDLLGVWTILEAKDLLPPSFIFPEVEQGVKAKMGKDFKITETLRPWHYNHLFSGRTRQFNCYDCFFMRRYEFAYMYLRWPEQFWQAVGIEETTGAGDFTLIKNHPLRRFAERTDEIIQNRVNKITATLYQLAQTNIFEEALDELTLKSCGMFCGK